MSDISIDRNKNCRQNTLVLISVAISTLAVLSIIIGLVVFFRQQEDILKANVKLVIANRNFTDNMLDVSSGGWMSIEKPFCAEMDIYYKYSDMGSFYLRCKLKSLRSSDDPKGLGVHITLDFQNTITTKTLYRIKEIIMQKSGRRISHRKYYLVIRNFLVYLRSLNVDIKIPPIPEIPLDHSTYASSSTDAPVSLYTEDKPFVQNQVLTDKETYMSHMSINASWYLSSAYAKQTTAFINGKTNTLRSKIINSITPDVSRVSTLIQASFINIIPTVSQRDGMSDISVLFSHYDTLHSLSSGEVRFDAPDQAYISEHSIPRTLTTEPIRKRSMSIPIMISLMGESAIGPTTVQNTMSSSPLGTKLLLSPLKGAISTQEPIIDKLSVSFSSTSYKTFRSSETLTDRNSTIALDFETVYSSFNKISIRTATIPFDHVPNKINTIRSLEKQSSLLYITKTPLLYLDSEQSLHENTILYSTQSNSWSRTLKVLSNFQPLQKVTKIKVNPSSTNLFLSSVNSTNRCSQEILVSSTLVKHKLSEELVRRVNQRQEVTTRTEISIPITIAIEQSRDVTEGMPVLKKEPNHKMLELVNFRPNIDLAPLLSNNIILPSQKQLNVSDNHNIQIAKVNGNAKHLFTEPINKDFTLSRKDGLEKMGVPISVQSMPDAAVIQGSSTNNRSPIFDINPVVKTIEDIWEEHLTFSSAARSTGTLLPSFDVERKEMIVNSGINTNFDGSTSHTMKANAVPTSISTSNPRVGVIETTHIIVNSKKGYVVNANGYGDLVLREQTHETSASNPYEMALRSFVVPSSNFKLIQSVLREVNISEPVTNNFQINAPIYLANEFPTGAAKSHLETHDSMNSQNAIKNAETNKRALLPNFDAGIASHAIKPYNSPTSTSTFVPRGGVIETKQSIVNSTKDIIDNVSDHGKLDPQLETQSEDINTPNRSEMTSSDFEVRKSTNNGALETIAGYKNITYTGDILPTDARKVIADTHFSNVILFSNINLTHPVLNSVADRKPALSNLRINAQSFVTKAFPIGSNEIQLGTLEKLTLVPINQSPRQIRKWRPAERAINGILSGPEKDKVTNPISWNSQNVFINSSGLQIIMKTGVDSRLENKRIHSFHAAVDEAGEGNIPYVQEQLAHLVRDSWKRSNLHRIGHKHLISLVERANINEISNSLPQQPISKLRNINASNFVRSSSPNASLYQTYLHPMITEIRPLLTVNRRALPKLFQVRMAAQMKTHLYKYPKHKYLRHHPWQKTTNKKLLTYIKTLSYGSLNGGIGRYLLNSPRKKFVKINGHVHILPN